MERLEDKIQRDFAGSSYEQPKMPEQIQSQPRIWSVTMVVGIEECKIDGGYVVVRRECVANNEHEAMYKLGVQLNQK